MAQGLEVFFVSKPLKLLAEYECMYEYPAEEEEKEVAACGE